MVSSSADRYAMGRSYLLTVTQVLDNRSYGRIEGAARGEALFPGLRTTAHQARPVRSLLPGPDSQTDPRSQIPAERCLARILPNIETSWSWFRPA